MTFPLFHLKADCIGEATDIIGSVTRTTHGHEKWIDEGWVGFLRADARLVAGRWRRRGDLWQFTPENRYDIGAIAAREEWEVLDGYWGARAEIVLDETQQWEKTRFESTDAIRVSGSTGVLLKPLTDTGEHANRGARLYPSGTSDAGGNTNGPDIVKAAWDHEHCAICWETIGPGGQTEGFVNTQQTWVCECCYVNFVRQRSLGFIPSV